MAEECGVKEWMLEVLDYFRNQINEVVNSPGGYMVGLIGNDRLMDMLINMVRANQYKFKQKFINLSG